MRVAIAHNALSPDARADESDVLVQVREVRNALGELGHASEAFAVDLNLQTCLTQIAAWKPDVVFNLIESLAGSDQLVSLAVALVESLGLPLTGSSAEALWLTNHKVWTKQKLQSRGLPTPEWLEADSSSPNTFRTANFEIQAEDSFIVKPIGEHASLGMEESSVMRPRDFDELVTFTRQRSEKLGRTCFAERFIAGREFNVSLLADSAQCQVLPMAEIDFSAFPPEKPRIVDYKAKWETESFEFRHTPRIFLDNWAEPELADRLANLACDCWRVFQLGGYVRVDFRVDDSGEPWILEINTNPCLSPDAGYAAALRQAGIALPQAIQRILADALRNKKRTSPKTVHVVTAAPQNDRRLTANDRNTVVEKNRKPAVPKWRYDVERGDSRKIRELVAKTGFFYPDEVAVAEELVEERLTKGPASGYHFVFAELEGHVAGYACYGPIACTRDSYDLFWIAVDPDWQGHGIGRLILAESERCIRAFGGRRVYIETSNREQYQSTRGFYLCCGYACEATLAEFYGPGDDKVIYVKALD